MGLIHGPRKLEYRFCAGYKCFIVQQTNVIWAPATKYVAVCIGTTAELNRSTPASKKPRKPANFRYTSGLDKPGIGRAIYRSYENVARSKGVISFECYCSLKAEAFYAALVFKSIEAISIDLGPNIV
jgi:hypothetical protein